MNYPSSFPMQEQKSHPGSETEMKPAPIYDDINILQKGNLLENKIAIITGGDSGIGRSVSLAFARQGCDIVIVYYNQDKDAEDTKGIIEKENRKCTLIKGDIGDVEFCKNVINKTVSKYGEIDILVNNAAVQYEEKNFIDIDDGQFDKTMKTNVYGTFYMTREALKQMKSGSSIINTASVVAFKGNEKLVDYSMTKGAIVALTRSLATELAKNKSGIRVNSVAPGPIWTPLIPSSFTKEEVASFGKDTPLGRAGQPVECANCYVFLASEGASYITGQTIHVNGGEIVNS